MFMPVLESMGKITGATMEMQQEMFKKWFSIWPGVPVNPFIPEMTAKTAAWGEKVQKIRKQWVETVHELLERQRDTVEAQFKAGQKNIEKAFQIGEAKSPEELRAKTQELWQKCIESVRHASEAQIRDFTVAIEKWVDLMTATFPTEAFSPDMPKADGAAKGGDAAGGDAAGAARQKRR